MKPAAWSGRAPRADTTRPVALSFLPRRLLGSPFVCPPICASMPSRYVRPVLYCTSWTKLSPRSDMEPVPLEHQTWTGWTFAAFWFSDLVNAGSWTQISSFVGMGLTWWEGVIATFLGGLLIAIAIVFNGIAGARLHTPFAVSSRAAFGYWLSRFAVVSRMVIAW